MPKFSHRSSVKLNTCSNNLIVLSTDVIKYIDFTIITGHRGEAEQDKLYPKYSKVKWPNGKHNKLPSLGLDVAPFIPGYGVLYGNNEQIIEIALSKNVTKIQVQAFIKKAYARLIGHFEMAAGYRNIKIRVGMDWDGDFDMLDQKFHDLGHIELMEE